MQLFKTKKQLHVTWDFSPKSIDAQTKSIPAFHPSNLQMISFSTCATNIQLWKHPFSTIVQLLCNLTTSQ
jgi:hypothetical protein